MIRDGDQGGRWMGGAARAGERGACRAQACVVDAMAAGGDGCCWRQEVSLARRGTGAFFPTLVPVVTSEFSKPTWKSQRRSRVCCPEKRTSGGPGMHAFFMDCGRRKSCGTGVFLPRSSDGGDQQPAKKHVCSPVLLPARVVQALSVSLNEGAHPPSEAVKDASPMKSQTCSPTNRPMVDFEQTPPPRPCNPPLEVLLPEEWSY